MVHCPQCGKLPPEGAIACPYCGHAMAPSSAQEPLGPARTIVGGLGRITVPLGGGAGEAAPEAQPAAEAAAPPNNRTIVGMPSQGLVAAIDAAKAAAAQPSEARAARTIVGLAGPGIQPHGDAVPGGPARTLLGGVSPFARAAQTEPTIRMRSDPPGVSTLVAGTPANPGAMTGDAGDGPARTLLGVARPGIAPLAPGMIQRDSLGDLAPAGELGATIGPMPHGMRPPQRDLRIGRHQHHRGHRAGLDAGGKKKTSKRAVVLASAAGGLALAAVLIGVFWPSAPPLSVRPKADAQGHEAVEITCASCPAGTKVSIGEASATVADHVALVPLPTELTVGENRLKVTVDRPKGKSEIVPVNVHVGYRVHPDLGTLQGDRPAISIVAQAARGTTVALDGKPMQLVEGRGLEKIDVVEALSGISDETKTLSRQVPYVVTPSDGAPESGVVSVSVGIVPLHIDAPGARVTTDQPSFVLAGHTMKGAEILAAGRPIPVKPDGTFAQVMNVSSVGATQIEVRAKMPGMAPRLMPIRVRRVDNLDAAAKDFQSDQPVDFGGLEGAQGKPVVVGGEVLETRRQGYETILLLDVAKSFGCTGEKGACNVRLVQGAENAAKKGDKLRAYGRVGPPFTAAGKAVPEIEVEFTLKGLQ